MPIPRFVLLLVLLSGSLGLAKGAAPADDVPGENLEDVTRLAPYEVKGDRMEEIGFRFMGQYVILGTGKSYVMVREVFPNTAAAKAGLRPGELISKVNGKSVYLHPFALNKAQQLKWGGPESGKKSVSCSLEVRAPGAATARTVTMVLPSPAPHWGSRQWSAPEGRTPAVVPEPGPLAALSRDVLDNGIWSVLYFESLLGAPPRYEAPVLGYTWRIVLPSGSHCIWVTQQRGKTEIVLETKGGLFLTSPSGAMDKAQLHAPPIKGKQTEFSDEEVRARFQAEIDFWLTKVGRVTGRWPFEALAGETEVIAGTAGAKGGAVKVGAPLAESFLKLPVATPAQKELFLEALGKIGLDEDGWAFTETARSLDDNRVMTVRFDPSKPPEESSTLLLVDGKAPPPAYLQKWRSEGQGVSAGLSELPALTSLVDVNEVRVASDETAAVVFELPVKESNANFPAGKFQARFRVNKTHHGFEDFSVKLRESVRVAGIAKLTDAGLEARFQTFDPALAPQPVWLKLGGGVRVLFVKVTRAFEVTRTDFKRMVPYEVPVKPAL